jgi:asparaginyl-tRNA synthetase
MRIKIKKITTDHIDQEVKISGWVRSVRSQKDFSFIMVNDGSNFNGIQVIADVSTKDYENVIKTLTTGCSVSVVGKVVKSKGKEQALEISAKEIILIGACDSEKYPLQKKRHSFEFLREIAHLRPRTNTQGAVTRVRNSISYATHKFFQEQDFLYIHTPIITGSDCEGAGELFNVTTFNTAELVKQQVKKIDYSKDFFGRQAFLTVSGQLNAEAFSCSLSDVYTFGPTFRAENSNTSRHLAEFWMIEPEIAFADLNDNVALAEKYVKYCINYVLENNQDDMVFFNKFIKKGILEHLQKIMNSSFERISYTDAIDILKKAKRKFEYPVVWEKGLQTEHERYLCEEYCDSPVVVFDYPKEIKAFYMRLNDDEKTVAAMDVLVPGVGELIGGSQREERLDVLDKNMDFFEINKEDYWWYRELRIYGTVPHAGFGLGLERFVQFVTGIENIRDVIPFPRYPKHMEF